MLLAQRRVEILVAEPDTVGRAGFLPVRRPPRFWGRNELDALDIIKSERLAIAESHSPVAAHPLQDLVEDVPRAVEFGGGGPGVTIRHRR